MIKVVRLTRLENMTTDFLQEVDISLIQKKYLDKGYKIKSVSTAAVWPKIYRPHKYLISYTYVLEKV